MRRTPLLLTLILLLPALTAGAQEAPPEGDQREDPPPETTEPSSEAEATSENEPSPEEEDTPAAEPRERARIFKPVDVSPTPTKWRGEPITLSLRDADLVEVLRSFAELADFNLVLDPGVKGTVTVELRDVPWDQALAMILKINGLAMEVSGNVWSVQDCD